VASIVVVIIATQTRQESAPVPPGGGLVSIGPPPKTAVFLTQERDCASILSATASASRWRGPVARNEDQVPGAPRVRVRTDRVRRPRRGELGCSARFGGAVARSIHERRL